MAGQRFFGVGLALAAALMLNGCMVMHEAMEDVFPGGEAHESSMHHGHASHEDDHGMMGNERNDGREEHDRPED